MSPSVTSTLTGVLFKDETLEKNVVMATPKEKYEIQIVWAAVIVFTYNHLAALYGVYLMFTSAKLMTAAFAFLLCILCCLGVTAGAHRLWSHRAFKAKWPLQVLLMVFNTMAFQFSASNWARDHRLHHKYSETNADPYNAKRGFFFAHVGWLLCRKHPEVKAKGKEVDINDLKKNPVLVFQKRYYMVLVPLLCFFVPTVVPVLCWNETWSNAFFTCVILRYVLNLNGTWLINSAAHLFGNKPYDRFINPSENMVVSFAAGGEGWHNYHHTFPWDYKAAELGNHKLNVTTAFIDLFAKIGWAYDLKVVPREMVQKRTERTGDGSHEVWGRGDADQMNNATMAPNVASSSTGVPFEDDTFQENVKKETPKEKYERSIIWAAVIIYGSLHLAALYGAYLLFTSAKLMTAAFALGLYILSGLGVTAGAHRLWSHKAYKAKWPLQVLLMILNTIAFQYSAINWARDHRLHHKYSETNADPHNPTRGFFFAHIGWVLCRRHPDVKEKGKQIDINDLHKNPVLAFQKRYYIVLMPLLAFIIPTAVPVLCWNETWSNAFFVPGILRFVLFVNASWLINSAGHKFGNRPYDKFIEPSDNMIANIFTFGEGWHNYHHVFPWDYKTSELGNNGFTITTTFIDFFAKIGWAYDLKIVPTDLVQKRVKRTGDGSHEVWGWGDADQTQEDRDQTVLMHRLEKD